MFDPVNSDEPIATIRRGIEGLAGEDRSGWSSGALSDRLAEVAATREALEAESLRLTAEWDRRRAWEADGALSAASWLTHRLPMSRSRAHEDVRTARFIDSQERVAKAMSVADISVDHARALARAVNDRRQDLFLDHADTLVDAAEVLSVSDFTKVARRWAQLADDQLSSAEFVEQFEARRLTLSRTFGGAVHVEGLLDVEAGALAERAIDLLSSPDPNDTPDGSRTAPQRRADAFVEMCRMVLQGAEGTGVSPTNLNVIADVDTMAYGMSPTGTGNPESLGDSPPLVPIIDRRSDIDRAGPIGWETLLRMTCDTSVCRVVMKGQSEILDMGRKTRLVTTTQRRALVIRDGGCVFSGCDRPESWCDAHHVEHWVAHDGSTDLDNLALLCRRHHVLVHEGGWMLGRDENGDWQARAPDR